MISENEKLKVTSLHEKWIVKSSKLKMKGKKLPVKSEHEK